MQLSESLILQLSGAASLANIHTLNLHGNGLHKVKYLHNLPALRRLTVSFNELTRVDDFAHMVSDTAQSSFYKLG